MGSDIMKINIFGMAAVAAVLLLGLSGCGEEDGAVPEETSAAVTSAVSEAATSEVSSAAVTDAEYGFPIMPRHATELRDYTLDLEAADFTEFCEREFPDSESLDFFTQSQKDIYARSLMLVYDSCSELVLRYTGDYEQYIEENSYLFHTGITYDSFYSYLTSVYTEEAAKSFYYTFRDVDGELCYYLGGTGTNITYKGGKYSLVGINSERIDFVYNARYSLDGVVDKAEWEAGLYPDIPEWEWTVQTNIAMINTADGWRMERYPTWY